MVRCMAAAGVPDLSPLDVLVAHTIAHRSKPKRLADICLVLSIEDTICDCVKTRSAELTSGASARKDRHADKRAKRADKVRELLVAPLTRGDDRCPKCGMMRMRALRSARGADTSGTRTCSGACQSAGDPAQVSRPPLSVSGFAAGFLSHLRPDDGPVARPPARLQHPRRRRFRVLVHGRDGLSRPRPHFQIRRHDPRRPADRPFRRRASAGSSRSFALVARHAASPAFSPGTPCA